MNAEWTALLTQAGAVFDAGAVAHFGDLVRERRAVLEGTVLCDLSQHGLISATGTDTVAFLQGQFTNDVRQVTPGRSQLSALCSPKGRMLACLRIFQHDDDYYLRLPRERVEPILKRLQMFVLRAQTKLTDASDTLARLGLAGSEAAALITAALGAAPVEVDGAAQLAGVTVIRLPGVQPRFELHGDVGTLRDLWLQFAAQATPAGTEVWRLLDILAGVPTVYAATAEAFVPQMANLQIIDGVSFKKGCYTGQEIVARSQYLGKLKRRMYLAKVETATAPCPGDELFCAGMEGSVGKVVDASLHPDGGYRLLAVIVIEHALGDSPRLRDADGAALTLLPLPYAFPDEAA